MRTVTAQKLFVTAFSIWKGDFYEFVAWEFEDSTVMLPNDSEPDPFYAGRPDRFFANRQVITTYDNNDIQVESVEGTGETFNWDLAAIKASAQRAANYHSGDEAQLFLNWLNQL
jgi:hypothetical protein